MRYPAAVQITLNGEPHQLDAPLTVSALLQRLQIDARRVAVEHNLVVLKRAAFDTVVVQEGDQVEVVNFVGGGSGVRRQGSGVRGQASGVRRQPGT